MKNRILVTGGRNYNNQEFVYETLDKLDPPATLLIAGGATGADTLAEQWAKSREIPHIIIPAQWKKHGRGAGPKRNAKMLELKPTCVIAFKGGSGTRHMTRIAQKANIQVIECRHPAD